MVYVLRNRFGQGMTPAGPIRQFGLGMSEAAAPGGVPTDSQGHVQGSGPGYAGAYEGDNRFLSNGKIMLSGDDPDAPSQMAKHPGQYQMPAGGSTLPSQFQNLNMSPTDPRRQQIAQYQQSHQQAPGYAGQATKGTSIVDGQVNLSTEQSDYMAQQIAATAAKNKAAQGGVNAYARGGIISEPVKGVGQQSGQRYLFGENGPESVSPMGGAPGFNGPVDAADDDGGDGDLVSELQKVLGRHIFARPKQSVKKNKATAPFRTDTKAVNAPVIQVTAEEIKRLASDPEFNPLIQRLIQAEQRGGIQVTNDDGSPYGPQGPQSEFGPGHPSGPTPTPVPAPGNPGPIPEPPISNDPVAPGDSAPPPVQPPTTEPIPEQPITNDPFNNWNSLGATPAPSPTGITPPPTTTTGPTTTYTTGSGTTTYPSTGVTGADGSTWDVPTTTTGTMPGGDITPPPTTQPSTQISYQDDSVPTPDYTAIEETPEERAAREAAASSTTGTGYQ